jgi:hypothetical protein
VPLQITSAQFLIGFALAVLTTLFYFSKKGTSRKKHCGIAAVLSIAIIALSVFVGGHAIDCSYDGVQYHQEIVDMLASGWNPYINTCDQYDYLQVWSTHYAYGLELVEACLAKFFGILECGKAVNLILISATALICYRFIVINFSAISAPKRIIVWLASVLNPVVLGQCLTFYIDYAFYCYLLMTIAFSVEIFNQRDVQINYIGLFMTIILAVSTKFNAFFMEGISIFVVILGFLIYSKTLFKAEIWRYLIICFLATVSAVFIICYHPYLTNFIAHGNPFYPLMGHGAIDIMTGNTPELYCDGNRITNFFRSIFSFRHTSVDQRIGGFGPLFSGIFIISLLILVADCVKLRKVTPLAYGGMCILVSCFFFEQSWWARYNTQLWLLPGLALLSSYLHSNQRNNPGAKLLVVMIACNISFVATCAVVKSIESTAYRNAIYTELTGQKVYITQMREQWRRQFRERHSELYLISTEEIDTLYAIHYRSSGPYDISTDPMIQLNREQREHIDASYNSNPVVHILRRYKLIR